MKLDGTDSAKARASHLVSRKVALRVPRKEATENGQISSLGTARINEQCLKTYLEWRDFNGLPRGEQDNRRQLITYLEERAEVLKQSSLNQAKNALQLMFGVRLPNVISEVETILCTRSYSPDEFAQTVQHQSERNALFACLAWCSGLRAHESATLRRLDELSASPNRRWSPLRFDGMSEYRLYVVKGKGGLQREVAVPLALADALELRRLDNAVKVVDRGVFYETHYDVGFGQAASQSFTDASVRALGFSRGAHGLRHSYVKNRTNCLTSRGYSFDEAQLIVSQEVGHFRPSITIAYYR